MSTPADTRLPALRAWLTQLPPSLGLALDTLRPASSDASFRRYFRLDAAGGTAIVMDAPPPHEDCAPFLHVARLLAAGGVNVPRILAEEAALGFLLLSDLGQDTFYDFLQSPRPDAQIHALYLGAIDELVRLQQIAPTGLPAYDARRLADELLLFPEWYVARHCGHELTDSERMQLERVFALLAARNAAQPTVLVHRDFHSPNLMVPIEGGAPGVIDFQDALAGPITYDIASLLMDARTTWDEPQQLDWGIRYWEAARKAGLPVNPDIAEFHADWEWMGLQRNLRILGVFARLHHRDGKPGYLRHLDRVSEYVRQAASHADAFRPLLRLMDTLDAARARQASR
ncbi:phosphotransferase [Verticiella sediminum]|uniref:Phosphotransferase n=1 Tax=Verticiella sediminum TaxID=1247510 RepID=A0A556B1Y8_9BURK|nr:phosphotransferase [Verticiella sediminum]TSH99207.1 phosphotransferase [Verticiella sediminum]